MPHGKLLCAEKLLYMLSPRGAEQPFSQNHSPTEHYLSQ